MTPKPSDFSLTSPEDEGPRTWDHRLVYCDGGSDTCLFPVEFLSPRGGTYCRHHRGVDFVRLPNLRRIRRPKTAEDARLLYADLAAPRV